MAGDWIPVRKDLATTREVLFIAQHTGQDIGTVIFAILRLWWWFDSEAVDGFVSGLCPAFVHNFLGQDETFWRTVVESGWLIQRDGGLAIPNPKNWHSKTAKVRLLDSRRKRDSRKNIPVPSIDCPADIPTPTGQKPDKHVTTGQDRIGEGTEGSPNGDGEKKSRRVRVPPSADQMALFERRDALIAHLKTKLGDEPMPDPKKQKGLALKLVKSFSNEDCIAEFDRQWTTGWRDTVDWGTVWGAIAQRKARGNGVHSDEMPEIFRGAI